ncbi:MAG: ABC transporter substrate-binding protein [Thermodesulfobacteriota bacterium]
MRLSVLLSLALLVLAAAPEAALAGGPPYSRVVSLYAAHAENLAAMGAGGLLAGVSEPLPGVDAPLIGARDGAEAIAALKPDLVLARPMHRSVQPGLLEQLERLGIAVACLQPVTPGELEPYWLELGRLTGRETEAMKMAGEFRLELAEMREAAARIPAHQRKRVFFESIHRQMKTVTPGSMAAFVLESAGAVNLAGDAEAVAGTNIARYGLERVIALGESMDAYLAQRGPMNPVTIDEIRATPGFEAIRAVREGRIYLVDEALVSRPTPRLLDGVRTVSALLYPEGGAR